MYAMHMTRPLHDARNPALGTGSLQRTQQAACNQHLDADICTSHICIHCMSTPPQHQQQLWRLQQELRPEPGTLQAMPQEHGRIDIIPQQRPTLCHQL
jgi:hypothetical protein